MRSVSAKRRPSKPAHVDVRVIEAHGKSAQRSNITSVLQLIWKNRLQDTSQGEVGFCRDMRNQQRHVVIPLKHQYSRLDEVGYAVNK